MDINSAVGRAAGISDEKIHALGSWRTSEAFTADERLVLAYADAMSATPVNVPEELFAKLRERFSEPQLVELTAAIAWENYRARFNRAFLVDSAGFSEGAACAL